MSAVTMRWQDIPCFVTSDERLLTKGWHVALIGGTHRECTILDKCNALEIERMLDELDPEQEHWGGMRASHWAVGWYHHLLIDPQWELGMELLRGVREQLDDYPILNEDKLGEMELEAHWDNACDHTCSLDHCRRCGNAVGEHARGKYCMNCRLEG